MPARPPAPGAIKVQLFHTQEGRSWSCSLFYSDTHAEEYLLSDVTALTTAVHNGWAANVVPLLSTECSLTDTVGTDLFSDTAPRFELPSAVPGTQADEVLGLNIAAVVKRIQDRRYRGGKSHIYVAGLTVERTINATQFNAAFGAGLVSGVETVDHDAGTVVSSHGDPFVPVAVSYFNGGVERASGVLFAITGSAFEQRICTRRKRLPKIAG